MLTVLGAVLVGLFIVRFVVGWTRTVRWAPEGDALLSATMAGMKPRVGCRVACATVDLNPGAERVRWAFNRCDADTVFEVGSVTKALTGLALADAIGRSEITSSTTLGEIWASLSGCPAASITIGELAHHTSGLPRTSFGPTTLLRGLLGFYPGLDPYRRVRLPTLLRVAARARLRRAGAQRYSNIGAALAGQALARNTHLEYPQLMNERLFGPLGMTSTSAAPNAPRPSGRTRWGSWVQPWRLDAYAPAGGVTSTLRDCTRLLEALLERTAPGIAALEDGLFWQIAAAPNGRRRFWHNGQTAGHSTYLAVYPDARRAVVVLASVADAERQQRLSAACIRAVVNAHDSDRLTELSSG